MEEFFSFSNKSAYLAMFAFFNSSTIATYGFMAVKSLWPVHFIITSAGIPRRREFTTKVRRTQCVAMSGYTQYTMFFY